MLSQSQPERPGKAPLPPAGEPRNGEAFDGVEAYLDKLEAHFTALEAWLRAQQQAPRE